jgi:anthranilate synthase component 2
MNLLLIDNYDSFTWTLRDLILQCEAGCTVVRNDAVNLEDCADETDALVISPGPGRPPDAGLPALLAAYADSKPILGVCLGHQAIGEHFGAKLGKAPLPRHGKVDEVLHSGDELFQGVSSGFNATRYHSLVLEALPSALLSIASTHDGVNMAIRHVNLPVWGIQFHPESCMTPYGITILKNFVRLANSFV